MTKQIRTHRVNSKELRTLFPGDSIEFILPDYRAISNGRQLAHNFAKREGWDISTRQNDCGDGIIITRNLPKEPID